MNIWLRTVTSALSLAIFTPLAWSDTARMQKVASQLGIDDPSSTLAAKEAADAVERLVAMGLKSYPTLREREALVAQRQSEKDAAKANYQPKLAITANANQQNGKDFDTDVRNKSDGRDINIVLRQNIWRGGQDSGQVELSEQNQVLAELNRSYEQESLNYAIRKAALDYNYRSLRQLIDEVSYSDASELRSLADRKLQAGQVGKIDIYTTSMRESSAKAAAARAAIESKQAYQRLTALLGPQQDTQELEAEINRLKGRTLPYPEQMPLLVSEKVATFEEKNAEAVAKRADITLDQGYRQRFLPQVDLIGQLSRAKNKANYDLDKDITSNANTAGTYVQLQLNWALYDRSADHLNKAAAEEKNLAIAQSETAQYRTQTESLRIKTYVQDLYNNLASAIEAYKASGQLYDAQRKLYETGVVGIQVVIDAEAEKRNAIGVWHQNVYELQLNLLTWNALQRGFLPTQ